MHHFIQQLRHGWHLSRNRGVQDGGSGRNQVSSTGPNEPTASGHGNTVQPAQLQTLESTIVGLAVDLYRRLVVHVAHNHAHHDVACGGESNYARENVIFSPVTVAAALSMTLAGARSKTAEVRFPPE
ncbi:hypothetical protein HPB51_012669 [Rhipicephalus microplus]|uniref:Serpin domain-containing protein n=1 Tax=Rhipicephalus microplus TaxID=6941 RepID=A0A9J6E0R9_RHIMP|nr:hypothetical protein HPB51_012669 [Rhipicephalus microplus]